MKKIIIYILFTSIISLAFTENYEVFGPKKTFDSIKPLEKEEYFDFHFLEDCKLKINIRTESKEINTIIIDNVAWGELQRSFDKKRILFLNGNSINVKGEWVKAAYLLDGNTGEFIYIAHLPMTLMSTADLKRICIPYYENKHTYLKVVNLDSLKIEWSFISILESIKDDITYDSVDYVIFRSNMPTYDFNIFLVGENDHVYNKSHVNIENKTETKGVMPCKYSFQWNMEIENITDFECGF